MPRTPRPLWSVTPAVHCPEGPAARGAARSPRNPATARLLPGSEPADCHETGSSRRDGSKGLTSGASHSTATSGARTASMFFLLPKPSWQFQLTMRMGRHRTQAHGRIRLAFSSGRGAWARPSTTMGAEGEWSPPAPSPLPSPGAWIGVSEIGREEEKLGWGRGPTSRTVPHRIETHNRGCLRSQSRSRSAARTCQRTAGAAVEAQDRESALAGDGLDPVPLRAVHGWPRTRTASQPVHISSARRARGAHHASSSSAQARSEGSGWTPVRP